MLQQHLYLCGYRGCGKSTVARALADRLQVPWVDTDDQVERVAGQSIAEIFAAEGESGFRDRETAAVTAVSTLSPRVVALGGGAVLRAENVDVIRRTGRVVWLDASPDILAARIAGDASTAVRRPSLTGRDVVAEVREVLRARRPVYEAASDFRVDTVQYEIPDVVDQIVASLELA